MWKGRFGSSWPPSPRCLGLVPRAALGGSAVRDEIASVEVTDFSLSLDVWLVHPPAAQQSAQGAGERGGHSVVATGRVGCSLSGRLCRVDTRDGAVTEA
jgi:hypothetical protein